ncbi:MAG: phenylacetate--CoA ligase family protein [Deltaproteobacteria bacterium]|nr:MAG: phenylacetate--CoA ligase family protein [Deltaproteobacteria bacterium]
MEMESILNTPEMAAIQLEKLRKLIVRLHEGKPFWRERMEKAGVRPGKIRTLRDFGRSVPVFDKAQRRKLTEECGMDMARVVDCLIGVPAEKLSLMAATSGTTGEPTPYPMTQNDIEWLSENIARMHWRIGVRPGDRIVHAFGLSMWLAGVPYAQFSQRSGACVFPVGAEGGTERILKFASLFKANVLACTPSLAEHLITKAPEALGFEVGKLGIKRLFCGGEPGAGIPEVRRNLESAYGARLSDHGAGFGISCDHPEYQGMHHVADDTVLCELVDPETYEPVRFEDGAKGLPVFTTLEGEGFLWFRETIGDVCQVFTEPCPCGATGFRYRIVGRVDDMLKVKGIIVYPAAIDGVIAGFMPRVTGEFRIVLSEPPPRVVPPLKLKVEAGKDVPAADLPGLAREIGERMKSRLKITPGIEWVDPGTLTRSMNKTRFIEKEYEKN